MGSWLGIEKVPHTKPNTFNLRITSTRRIRRQLRMGTRKNPVAAPREKVGKTVHPVERTQKGPSQ